MSLASLTVAEGAGAVAVTAAFDNPVRSATAVTFSAAGVSATAGTDFTVPPSFTVVVAEGETSGESTVTIVDDGFDEDDETFTLAATGGGFDADAVTVTISDDDTAGVSVGDSAVSVDEGATASYSVVLDARPTATVTVTPASSADAKATVQPAALEFTTGNWRTAQSFTVTAVAAGTSTITHTVASDDGDYSGVSVDDLVVTVRKPAPKSLSVSLASLTVAEGAGAVAVTAVFDNPVRSPTTVTFSAAGVSATAGTDFTVPPSFTVVVGEGETSGESALTIVDDGFDEDEETFTLIASGGGLDADAVTVTISDDDTAGVTVGDSAVSVDEGATATYSVVLDSRPTATVTVTPASSADAKATVQLAALEFTTGNWSTAQSFTVTGVAEGAATITHTVASDDGDYGGVSVADVSVTVEKPDPTKLTLSVDAQTPSESVGTVTVTATLDWPAKTGGVEVTLAAGSGSTASSGDYTLPGAFTIPAGQRQATAQLSITDDDIDDDDETIALTATATAAATSASLSVSGTTITITDNDAAAVALSAATLAIVQGEKKTYTAKLGSEPAASVTVTPTVAAAGESDPAVSVSAPLTFTSSNWSVAQTFTVSGIGAGTATINHSATGDSNYGSSLSVASVKATVTAPPTKLTLTTDATNNTIQEDGTTVTVTATLDRPAGSKGVTVQLSAAATSTAAA
ncbi:MAG: hypothetical protein OXB92_16860, partial [Acidimicrobiaceae bacterium]|nr:hypothetical protein [Acidimicrobiaceae bacterium]